MTGKTDASIRVGTCSWKYPSWAGLVYSSDDKSVDHLREYATKYDTVEIDQWFWSLFAGGKAVLPQSGVAEQYAAAVADDFRFTIKVPNSVTLTHYYRKNRDEALIPNPHFFSVDLFTQFLKTLAPLREKIGMLMFQFEYLNKQKQSSQAVFLKAFGNFLSVIPRVYPLGVEIRNPNYLTMKYFDFLNDNQVSCVFVQGYYMPDVPTLYDRWKNDLKRTVIIRLHGYDRDNMEKVSNKQWNRLIAPKDDELGRVAKMAGDLKKRNINVFINVNNHFEGSAPLTIERLRGLLT